jgi:uncharacterized protein (DUF924 family)
MQAQVDQILDDWFGALDVDGKVPAENVRRWFSKDEAFDTALTKRYGALIESALAGELREWESDRRATLALVLLLDQFTRNVFRGTGRMYAGDQRALSVVQRALEAGYDEQLPWAYRGFLHMPFMHSESLEAQAACVDAFRKLAESAPEPHRAGFENNHRFAIAHHNIVAQFGRFPHRNALLGRPSSDAELEFLKQPGSSF